MKRVAFAKQEGQFESQISLVMLCWTPLVTPVPSNSSGIIDEGNRSADTGRYTRYLFENNSFTRYGW